VIPPTMQVASPGFSASGTEQGYNVFSKESMKTGVGFDVTVSGTAAPPADASASAPPQDQVNGRDANSSPDTTVETAPARIGDERWILLGGLAAIFAVGVGLLLRKPVPEVANAPAPPSAAKTRKAQRAAQAKAAPPAPVRSTPASAPVERIKQEVNSNLDSLKDTLLRLELRRQAGTITDAEYALERGRAEQLLRDLVQG
jgi:hypothetical protein